MWRGFWFLGVMSLTFGCPSATTPATDGMADTDAVSCTGPLSGGIGVGPTITCSEERPCSGTAYIGIYDSNPTNDPELQPVNLTTLPNLDLATQSPVPFELLDVACGSNVLVAFLDIDGNAEDPPRPSRFDLYRSPEGGRMVAEGAETIIVLNERWR